MLWANNRWCRYIFIWVCQSTGPGVCCECLCVCVCGIKCIWPRLYVSDLSKLDALLYKTRQGRSGTKNLDMCRSILSLSKIASNLVWSPIHLKKHDNRKTSECGVEGWGWGMHNIWKRGNRQYRWGLHKIRGLALLCQLCKRL